MPKLYVAGLDLILDTEHLSFFRPLCYIPMYHFRKQYIWIISIQIIQLNSNKKTTVSSEWDLNMLDYCP